LWLKVGVVRTTISTRDAASFQLPSDTTFEYNSSPDRVRQLAEAYQGAVICGCSTSGEIEGTQIHDGSLVAAVLRFSRTALRPASAQVSESQGSYAAGESLAQQLQDPSLRGVLVFSDGLKVNGSDTRSRNECRVSRVGSGDRRIGR